MAQLEVTSDKDQLDKVMGFIHGCLGDLGVSETSMMQLELAVEEIFVNIANYAYHPHGSGDVDISCDVVGDRMKVVITFTDEGPEFDPLEREDPDTTLGADERPIGGLGIYLVKNTVDGISYRRETGRNILTVEKELS